MKNSLLPSITHQLFRQPSRFCSPIYHHSPRYVKLVAVWAPPNKMAIICISDLSYKAWNTAIGSGGGLIIFRIMCITLTDVYQTVVSCWPHWCAIYYSCRFYYACMYLYPYCLCDWLTVHEQNMNIGFGLVTCKPAAYLPWKFAIVGWKWTWLYHFPYLLPSLPTFWFCPIHSVSD